MYTQRPAVSPTASAVISSQQSLDRFRSSFTHSLSLSLTHTQIYTQARWLCSPALLTGNWCVHMGWSEPWARLTRPPPLLVAFLHALTLALSKFNHLPHGLYILCFVHVTHGFLLVCRVFSRPPPFYNHKGNWDRKQSIKGLNKTNSVYVCIWYILRENFTSLVYHVTSH